MNLFTLEDEIVERFEASCANMKREARGVVASCNHARGAVAEGVFLSVTRDSDGGSSRDQATAI